MAGRIRVDVSDHTGAQRQSIIQGPSYFGERAVFFDQPRRATVVSAGQSSCIVFRGEDIRRLVRQNGKFCRAFASVLRSKQRIFQGYDHFIRLLFHGTEGRLVELRDLVGAYRGMQSILHRGAVDPAIDFDALGYVLPRLPQEITSASVVLLAEELPEAYREVRSLIRVVAERGKKREFFRDLPGRLLILLRDGMTDTIDIVTKLCVYGHEAEKIAERMTESSAASELARLAATGNATAADRQRVRDALPFSAEELSQLERVLGPSMLERLHQLLVQRGALVIRVHDSDHPYSRVSSELWLHQIRTALRKLYPVDDLAADIDVHIVSSNTHSVTNCISPWIRQHEDEIVEWAQVHLPASLQLSNRADALYAASQAWINANPERAGERASADHAGGIDNLRDTRFTGIEVNLIDANSLVGPLDPALARPRLARRTLIVNVDYAYGQQAETIIRNLILLFGTRIRSISVFGKAGAIVGKRGDILLPNQLILQTSDELYEIPNCDLSSSDLSTANHPIDIHEGPLLTVLGTIMQNREMLQYYHLFWNVIGMEMEGSFYLREILRARSRGLIDSDVALRFAYYVSDTPLHPDPSRSLSTQLSMHEGVAPVYAITRAVLSKILVAGGH
jgi:CRP-like cAMP-binding protein